MTDLPHFSNPPVVEVALAVGFRPLAGFRIVDLGRLWERYQEAFPKVEEQPPLQMTVEQFGGRGSTPSVSLSLMATPPPPRVWFLDEDESQLVQVQNDWFARNWRKTGSSADYPRYPRMRAPFESDLGVFLDHVRTGNLGEFSPTQCEITYINHIPAAEATGDALGDVLTLLASGPAGRFPLAPESVTVAAQYVLRTAEGPVGRLHVSAQPAIRRVDGYPITVLTLTARGRPLGEGVEGVLSFLDLGHEWVVRGFDAATTEKMHVAWGRQQ